MSPKQQEIQRLQEQLVTLGLDLVEQLKGEIAPDSLRHIASYFEANEYGEAIDLVEWFEKDDDTFFTQQASDTLAEIRRIAKEIVKLWDEVH